jgi:hypothetical protein
LKKRGATIKGYRTGSKQPSGMDDLLHLLPRASLEAPMLKQGNQVIL